MAPHIPGRKEAVQGVAGSLAVPGLPSYVSSPQDYEHLGREEDTLVPTEGDPTPPEE